MDGLIVRPASLRDQPQLRRAVIEIQEHERRLHATRLPGEQVADAYLAWLQQQAAETGAVLIAEVRRVFAGFVAGWIEEENNVAETPDSNRYGYVSDIYVLPAYRGRRIAWRLLQMLEQHFRGAAISRMRIRSLATNKSALASYRHAGFVEYEVVCEKTIKLTGV
jgi:ribosomal protein S18 acetylase RimI-like enzyme